MQLAAQSQLAAPVKFSQLVDAQPVGIYYEIVTKVLQICDTFCGNVTM